MVAPVGAPLRSGDAWQLSRRPRSVPSNGAGLVASGLVKVAVADSWHRLPAAAADAAWAPPSAATQASATAAERPLLVDVSPVMSRRTTEARKTCQRIFVGSAAC